MARTPRITVYSAQPVVLRLAEPELGGLLHTLERRYPNFEWVSFARFGWRATPAGLVLTLATIDTPTPGDVDAEVGHVAVDEQYSLRIALSTDTHPLAVGIAHSHPVDCPPVPSPTDDDMDTYYASYFSSFAVGRPYVSLITSRMNDELAVSGRVWWRGEWHRITRVVAEGHPLRQWTGGYQPRRMDIPGRLARVASAYGREAAERLRGATVAVIGAGGTGSAVVEVLARGGVGRLVIVDPDIVEESNLERLHGASQIDVAGHRSKVEVARDHVRTIDPTCEVIAVRGALPQPEVVDAVLTADVMIGCTDQQHSRVALSDTATRFLIPTLDCGVALEGRPGRVTAQIIQLMRFLPLDPCVYCRGLVDPVRLTQELVSPEERQRRTEQAARAARLGEAVNPYWRDTPQLNTVGFLTTTAGAMVAGYAIGWITGRFDVPFKRLQMNLLGQFLDVTDVESPAVADCTCRRVRGWADQAAADALITAPAHWPKAQIA